MSETPALRILDASLNRAGEGLRVVEDYVRFVLDDPFLTGQVKALRHDFGIAASAIPLPTRHAARDTERDVGTRLSHAGEQHREDTWHVCAASFQRSAQSLRSLEEYGKLCDAEFAGRMEALRYRLYTLEKAVDAGRSSRERLEGVRLCVLVDGGDSSGTFERLITELVEAGVGMIQLRDKRLDDRELVARARSLVSLTRRQPPAEPGADGLARGRTLAVINDRADIAAAVDADGVHLGQEDLSVKDARTVVGTRMLIGISTHNIGQTRAAVLDGANYLGAGPTFRSSTKEFDSLAGLDYLREVTAETRLPAFAIGGITTQNLREVLATGIRRVAVSGAVTSAVESRSAARRLLDILNEAT
jgi:thiamine-phosphate pyrophosphorylase